MKRMTLSGLFGKTATAERICPCCGGAGEHQSGFECYTCDGGGTLYSNEDDSPCDGRYNDGGPSHSFGPLGPEGIMCVYPHSSGRRTAGEYGTEPSMKFRGVKTWTQARHYGAEDSMRGDLPDHKISSPEEAQQIANKVTDKAGVRRVNVFHRPGMNYSFAQAHPQGGPARIVLGDGGMDHQTLLHELAHHIDREKGSQDPVEPHGDSFREHFEHALVQHHPNSYVARDAFRHHFYWTDQKMRDGVWARHGHPNPEMNDREESASPVPKPTPMWESNPEHVAKANNAMKYREEPHGYLKYMPHYPELDYEDEGDYERADAHMADEDLSKGVSPHYVPPHMLAAWVKHHPDPRALEEPEWDEKGNAKPLSKQGADDGTVRMVEPEEYRKFHYPDYPQVKGGLGGLVRHFKKTDPDYFAKVRDDVQQNGFTTPILVRYKDPRGNDLKKPQVMEGHHRAAVAHDLGLHLPVGDYDNETDFQRSRQGNAAWFQKNERGPQGVSWGTEAALQPRQAAEDPDDPGLIHRGLTVVLPQHIHSFVHDENQPAGARAHMLLAHVRKAKPEITSEEAHGTTGGLGNYWSPRKEKAAEYGDQGGWGAYHEHEREHDCGDPETGYGGCKTTHVVLHAGTPPEKHHWTENFRSGEQYDPEISWRLPVRPDAKLMVHGISWKQGHDNESTVGRDFTKEQEEPFSRYDFLRPVRKRAKITFGPGAEEHIGEDEYEPDDGFTKSLWDSWHPQLPPTIHRALGVKIPADHPAHDTSRPMHERAQALLDDVSSRLGRNGLGMHWTSDPAYLQQHLNTRLPSDHTAVMLHAKTPAREHVEDNQHVLTDRAVRDWDMDSEREVPVKRNAPLHITGITWGDNHHDFDQPITRRASNPSDDPARWVWRQKDWDENRPQIEQTKNHDWFTLHAEPADPDEGDGLGRTRMIHAVSHDGQYLGNTFFGDHPTVPGHLEGAFEVNPQHRRKGVASAMYDYAEELHGKPMAPADKHSDYADAFWKARTAAYVPPGTMGTDSQGHGVQMTTMDGWAHRDGSHGHEDGPDIGERPVYTHDHTWLPHGRYWGPNSAQNDQRLFEGDHLRPEVRQDILDRVGGVLGAYQGWEKWTRVYFAGSQAAQWLDQNGQGNGDFDILIGIDFDAFRDDNPQYEELEDAEIATMLTEELWSRANVKDYWFTLDDGRTVGPFDRTFYCNPRAWDIKALHPYAAYNVTSDDWAVHPLQVPKDWSARSLPESYWDYAEALSNEIRAIGELPPEERHRMAANLWEEIHSHRSDAFGDGGHGLYDLSNIVMKYLEAAPGNPWEQLVQWKNESPSGPEPWVPTTARRTTLTELLDLKTAAEGADYGGVMIAIVPPRKICEKLAQEGGEPVEAMHVTLAYMPNQDRRKAAKALPELVEGWARTQKALKAHIGGVGTFVNPGQHVLWAAVDIPGGGAVRESLVETLERHGFAVANDHGWTPHITLDYRDHHVRFLPKIEPATWDVTSVHVCIGDNWTAVPLG